MVYFLIPSYNDSENFEKLLENISQTAKNFKFQVIIVDDGSKDKTKEVAKKLSLKYPLTLIGYSENKGPGFAFKFGFNFLISKLKSSDLVVTMEADNTADFKILPKMLEKAAKFDLVLASPFAAGGKFVRVSSARKLLSLAANRLDKLIFRIPEVNTYSSFYRVYRAQIIKKAKKIYQSKFITEYGFPVFVELLIKLNKIGVKICEVPAEVDWTKREGKSKMNIKKSTINHFLLYYKFLTGKYDTPK